MSNRDIVKTQIDVLPDSAVDKVIEFISFQLYILGMTNDTKPLNTWSQLDTLVAQLDVLPDFADFPRCDNERKLIDFAEVN